MREIFIVLTFISLYLISSCQGRTIPCLFDSDVKITEVILINKGAQWNCGLNEWLPSNDDMELICEGISNFQRIIPHSTQFNYWRIDIFFNERVNQRINPCLLLSSNKEEGLIFRNGHVFYKNDELAIFIANKMQLKLKSSDNTPCD